MLFPFGAQSRVQVVQLLLASEIESGGSVFLSPTLSQSLLICPLS